MNDDETPSHEELLGLEQRFRREASSFAGRIANPQACRHVRKGLILRQAMMQTSRLFIHAKLSEQGTKPLDPYMATALAVHLNAFYTNLSGGLDNLAWATTYECGLCTPVVEDAGKGTSRKFCDLFGRAFLDALQVRRPRLAAFLVAESSWHSELRQLRDPGAHRIPLGFALAILTKEEHQHAADLQKRGTALMSEGLLSTRWDQGYDLWVESMHLGRFQPVIVTNTAQGGEFRSAPDQLSRDTMHFHIVCLKTMQGIQSDFAEP